MILPGHEKVKDLISKKSYDKKHLICSLLRGFAKVCILVLLLLFPCRILKKKIYSLRYSG